MYHLEKDNCTSNTWTRHLPLGPSKPLRGSIRPENVTTRGQQVSPSHQHPIRLQQYHRRQPLPKKLTSSHGLLSQRIHHRLYHLLPRRPQLFRHRLLHLRPLRLRSKMKTVHTLYTKACDRNLLRLGKHRRQIVLLSAKMAHLLHPSIGLLARSPRIWHLPQRKVQVA